MLAGNGGRVPVITGSPESFESWIEESGDGFQDVRALDSSAGARRISLFHQIHGGCRYLKFGNIVDRDVSVTSCQESVRDELESSAGAVAADIDFGSRRIDRSEAARDRVSAHLHS